MRTPSEAAFRPGGARESCRTHPTKYGGSIPDGDKVLRRKEKSGVPPATVKLSGEEADEGYQVTIFTQISTCGFLQI